jgi:E3 ubiquitin-protein ligase RGLG
MEEAAAVTVPVKDDYSSMNHADLYAECIKRGGIDDAVAKVLRTLLREDDRARFSTTAAADDDDYAYMDQAELWAVVVDRGGIEGATETSKMKVLRKLLREDDKAREAEHEKRRALARATVFTRELVSTMKRGALIDALEAFELDTNGKLDVLRERLLRLGGANNNTAKLESIAETVSETALEVATEVATETVSETEPAASTPSQNSEAEPSQVPSSPPSSVPDSAIIPAPAPASAPSLPITSSSSSSASSTSSTSSSSSSSSPTKVPLKREGSTVSSPKAGTLGKVIDGMRTAGLVSSQMVVFIDCTKSNLDNGKNTFGGKNLHDVSDPSKPNLYELVLSTIGKTLSSFDADGFVPMFGFGDCISTDKSVFPLFDPKTNPKGDQGYEALVSAYRARIPKITLAGPTSFGPAIRKTIELVKANKPLEFTLCLILCDGQPNTKADTEAAIVEASKLPIAIIAVGIGDGPWDELRRFDDDVKGRKFDNFCFVELAGVQKNAKADGVSFAAALATDVLTELPSAYADSVRLGYLGKKW